MVVVVALVVVDAVVAVAWCGCGCGWCCEGGGDRDRDGGGGGRVSVGFVDVGLVGVGLVGLVGIGLVSVVVAVIVTDCDVFLANATCSILGVLCGSMFVLFVCSRWTCVSAAGSSWSSSTIARASISSRHWVGGVTASHVPTSRKRKVLRFTGTVSFFGGFGFFSFSAPDVALWPQEPDYNYCRSLFAAVLSSSGHAFDLIFDWSENGAWEPSTDDLACFVSAPADRRLLFRTMPRLPPECNAVVVLRLLFMFRGHSNSL